MLGSKRNLLVFVTPTIIDQHYGTGLEDQVSGLHHIPAKNMRIRTAGETTPKARTAGSDSQRPARRGLSETGHSAGSDRERGQRAVHKHGQGSRFLEILQCGVETGGGYSQEFRPLCFFLWGCARRVRTRAFMARAIIGFGAFCCIQWRAVHRSFSKDLSRDLMNHLLIPDKLLPIAEKIESRQRISDADALELYRSNDLNALGIMASAVRERKNGNYATYIHNRYINYSNICILSCQFCAFAAKKRDAHAFEHAIEEIVHGARKRSASASPRCTWSVVCIPP